LNGSLPITIGEAKFLQTIDVENIEVTGHLPSSLRKLRYVSTLDVSSNYTLGNLPHALSELVMPPALGELVHIRTLNLSPIL
jgi:hypothetical protein